MKNRIGRGEKRRRRERRSRIGRSMTSNFAFSFRSSCDVSPINPSRENSFSIERHRYRRDTMSVEKSNNDRSTTARGETEIAICRALEKLYNYMLPRVLTRFLFPLFRHRFFFFFKLFILLVFRSVTIAVRTTFASHRLSSSPFESLERVDLSVKNFPKSGPVLFWDRARGTRSGCPKVAQSRIVPTESSRRRTSRTRCVCWFMYVRTYEHIYIHTYIHICIFLYIDIYSAILFWSWYKGNENHFLFFFFFFFRKNRGFEKWKKVTRL